jgi:RNA polymerase sigma-70 factor (ECF subfamily)
MKKCTDKELLQMVVRKNTRAFKTLYERYEIGVFNFILRYTGSRELAQDLLQETFTRVWFAAHSFNMKSGNFKGWLFTIALNTARNEMVKKRYSFQHVDVDAITGEEAPANPASEQPDAVMVQTDIKESIAAALARLQPPYREIILLKHYQQLKFREIAEMTGTPEGMLKARFHKAIGQLKKHLQTLEL